jgi:hypothetical protein
VKDLHLSAQFTPTATGTPFGLIYRSDSSVPGSYEAQAADTRLSLYRGTTEIGWATISAVAAGTTATLDVVAQGAHHVVRLNGVKLIDVWDYSSLVAGSYGVDFAGAGTAANVALQASEPKRIGRPVFTEDELLGESSAAYWADTSVTGDGIHHPTRLGHRILAESADGLIEAAERVANAAGSTVVTATGTSTTGSLVLNDYVFMDLENGAGPTTMVTGSTGLWGATASIQQTLTVTTGQAVLCRLYKAPGTLLAQGTLTFPTAGNYVVLGIGTASDNTGAATQKHTVNCVAWKVD